jgi:hypothetical protein
MHFCISSLLECKCFSSSVGPWHASLALCIAKIVSNRAGKPPTEHCATPLSARHPSSQQLPPDRRNKSAQGLLRGGERVEQGARRRTGEAMAARGGKRPRRASLARDPGIALGKVRRRIGRSQAARGASRATATEQLPDYRSSGSCIAGEAPPLLGPGCVGSVVIQ